MDFVGVQVVVVVKKVSFAVKLVEPFYVSEIVTVHIFFFIRFVGRWRCSYLRSLVFH